MFSMMFFQKYKFDKILDSDLIPKNKIMRTYLACGSLFAIPSFIINNWTIYKYCDYYYRFDYYTLHNIIMLYTCHVPMISKSLMIGVAWPLRLSDFVFYSNEKSGYKAFRYIIPWMHIFNNIIINENDKRKYIDVNESLKQYGVNGFFLEGKCVKKCNKDSYYY